MPPRRRNRRLTKMLITSEGLPAVRLHTQGGDFYEKTYFLERGDPNRRRTWPRKDSCKC